MNLLKTQFKIYKRYYFIIILIGYAFFISKILIVFRKLSKVYSKAISKYFFFLYIEKNPKIIKKTINDSFEYYYAPDLCFYNKSPYNY